MINNKIYVEFTKRKQTEFLRKVKYNVPLTWINMAKALNVDRSMIYFYLDENSRLPYNSFIKLCGMANLNPAEFNYKTVNITQKGNAKIPATLTTQLTKFIGFLLGDGSIVLSNYQICVSMDGVLDEKYVYEILRNYFMSIFGKEPLICYSKRSMGIRCIIYSKEVCDFLVKDLGMPYGRRKYSDKNVIPMILFKDNELLKSVIRGLFDTEG